MDLTKQAGMIVCRRNSDGSRTKGRGGAVDAAGGYVHDHDRDMEYHQGILQLGVYIMDPVFFANPHVSHVSLHLLGTSGYGEPYLQVPMNLHLPIPCELPGSSCYPSARPPKQSWPPGGPSESRSWTFLGPRPRLLFL